MTNRQTIINSLNLFLRNINGLKRYKPELLNLFIEKHIDITLISETHCTPISKNFFPGYKIYRTNHPDGTAHGGSAIIISSKIQCQPIPNLQTNTIQATKIQITLNNIPTTISSVYSPPRPAISSQEVDQFLNSADNTSLIGGDFDAKHLQWGCRLENTRGCMFQNILRTKKYTFISPPGPTYWPSHRNRQPDILDLFLSTIPRHINFTIK
ncbi:Endonuclease/exonuclease/phosphatase [Cinara cedri]|uniref:Endonuclease/exonuclease/phosphatase n=1 Tax=Cinara cedri TaxID=506608 RepID=A0A5E4NF26_9HEMI|nr:Endonuclease/exonuclease/phosphatase [Cinara cedri]